MKKSSSVKNLDYSIPLKLARHGAVLGAHFSMRAPEDTALAQPFDEDALLIGTDQHTSLQMAKELARDMALAIVLDVLSCGEVNTLHAVRIVRGTTTMTHMLLRGDSAAFRMIDQRTLHQLSSIEETDHHLGESWRGEHSVRNCHIMYLPCTVLFLLMLV